MATERSVTRVVDVTPLTESVGADFGAALADMAVVALSDESGAVERSLRAIARELPVVVYALDPDGCFTWAHGGGLRSMGLADDELVGKSIAVFGERALAGFHHVMAGGSGTFEIEGTTAGQSWALKTIAAPLPAHLGVAAVSIDVTEGVQALHEHQRVESVLAAAVEAIDQGVVVQDATGALVRANSSAFEILGIEPDDLPAFLAGELGHRAIHEDGSPFGSDERPGRRSLRENATQSDVVMGVVAPSGEVRWISVKSFPVTLEGDRLVVSTFNDITSARAMTDALRENEQRFRMLSTSAPIGIFITDEQARITYANPELLRQTGLAFEEIRDRSWADIIHPDDVEGVVEELRKFLNEEAVYLVEHRLVRPDGEVCSVRARLARMTNNRDETVGLVGTSADISDVVEADARLRESEERTRAILETAAEGIISCNEQGLILEFNAAAERILGYDSDEVVGRLAFEDLLHPEVRPILMAMYHEHLDGAEPQLIGQPASEVVFVTKDGSTVHAELALTEVLTSEGRLFTGVVHDITERKAFETELEHQATHDALTGLPNRALLAAELEAALNRAARNHVGVGLLFIELGRMKVVTDSLGHRAGDQVVIEAARRLEGAIGASGQVARFGGEHFVVFAEDHVDVGDAVELAAKVIDILERPYGIGAEEVFINASVGVAYAPLAAGTADSMISNAAVAMNRARSAGGGGFEVFDAEMRKWVDSRRKLENAMRHGIDRSEFELYYQPVIALGPDRICGFEALVRWNHPNLGLVPPSDFIPLAEDSGLIVPLGERLLRDACRQLAIWQDMYPDRDLSVSVNLSGRQLALPDLPQTVARILSDTGADPRGLGLEITETVLLDDVESAATTLDRLKDIGVRLAMDDFGTGYSSLTYLCRFPIDVVKIDQSFVSQLGTTSRDASIVSVVIGLANSLDMSIVAEGVETEEQLAALRELDCQYGQGYFFARPQPVAEADRLLAE